MSENVICIGPFTIDKLRAGEAVKVQGVTLIAADGLFKTAMAQAQREQDVRRLVEAAVCAQSVFIQLSPTPDAKKFALDALEDALHYFENRQGGDLLNWTEEDSDRADEALRPFEEAK